MDARQRTIQLAAVLITAAVAVTACSPAPSSSTSLLKQVINRGTLRVATITGDAPYESVGASGQLEGYDIDIANALAKALGVKAELTTTDIAGRIALLQSNKADITIADLSMTLERAQTVAFTDPYALEGIQLMVKASSKFNDLADLNTATAKIGVGRGSAQAPTVSAAVPKAPPLTEFASLADEIQAVSSGQIDAAALSTLQIGQTMQNQPGTFRVLPTMVQRFEDNIGLPSGDFAWWYYVNTFVHQINTDGTNCSLYQKWIGGAPPDFVKCL
jgi:polar amino acid transport system substrate-binding protein